MAMIVHYNGKCDVKAGFLYKATKPMREALCDRGL